MKCLSHITRWGWAFLVAVTLTLGLGGCEGDDGAAGAAGAAGAPGADGADGADGLACWDLNGNGVGDLPDEDINGDGVVDVADCAGASAKVTPLESCAVCHSDGSFADAAAAHALDPIESVSNITFVEAAPILSISFDIEVDGVASEDYNDLQRIYVTEGTTNVNVVDFGTLTSNGGGNYTVDIDTVAAGLDTAIPSRYVLRATIDGESETRVYFYGDYPASPFAGPVAVSAEACGACHGPEGIHVHGGGFQAADGGEPCLVCHGVFAFGADRPSLGEVAHRYHSGIWEEDGEFVEVTYPTYMNNCSVCHSEDAQLATVNAMPVSGAGCFTCHGSMEGFDFTDQPFHLTIADPETADCTVCHSVGGVASTKVAVTDFHNGFVLDNDGILWDGADASLVEGAKFDWQITNVADDGTDLTITWQASYDGVGVDPCNDTVGPGAPVFHAGDGSLRTYRSYAQGEDFILGQSTSGAGQPNRANPTVDNTTCAGNVATTVIPAEAVDAERGRLALNGKPLVVNVDPAGADPYMEARVPTPTFDWLVGLGGPAPDRRNVVDTAKCVGCHVGSLYQHGGDRVDNVDTCLVCHNAAANEQYRRVAMGVDASEAYDGRVGETFEMRTMLHRIHSVNYDWDPDPNVERYNPPYLVYRGRGIYAFSNDVSDVPNWDVVSTEGCDDDEIARGERLVFGGDPESSSSCQPHNFHSATYPRSLNECTACHTDDFMVIPDQTKSMAVTTEAGSTEWINQIDDVLQGPGTSACITCHADGASKGHAYQNSWTPQQFPEGRQTIIDAVN